MNLLDDSLKVSNSAVVLAATKCFLNLTADLPEIRAQAWHTLFFFGDEGTLVVVAVPLPSSCRLLFRLLCGPPCFL